MRIAYLIIAHENPPQLARLVAALSKGSKTFIHIDASVDIGSFIAGLPESDSVHYISDREKVRWAGFGMVKATLKLIDVAVSEGGFEYYALISGSDYPICSDDVLFARLRSRAQFITCDRMPTPYAPLSRLSCYFLAFPSRNNLAGRLINKILSGLPLRRWEKSVTLPPHVGSSWWFLTHECVTYILSYLKDNPEYARGFYHSRYPDESFFHTLVAASPFRENIRGTLTYADWWRKDGPYPAILASRDISRLAQLDLCFARKFSENGSMAIFDLIDKELRGL